MKVDNEMPLMYKVLALGAVKAQLCTRTVLIDLVEHEKSKRAR